MGYKSLKDLAREKDVNIRSLQNHVKRHESELEGHIIRYGAPRGTFVDEYAEDFISGLLVGHPIAMTDQGLIAEIERLQKELSEMQRKVIQLQDEKTGLLERAITAEKNKELMETNAIATAEEITVLKSTLQEEKERADGLEKANKKLKSRSLWQRIIRYGED